MELLQQQAGTADPEPAELAWQGQQEAAKWELRQSGAAMVAALEAQAEHMSQASAADAGEVAAREHGSSRPAENEAAAEGLHGRREEKPAGVEQAGHAAGSFRDGEQEASSLPSLAEDAGHCLLPALAEAGSEQHKAQQARSLAASALEEARETAGSKGQAVARSSPLEAASAPAAVAQDSSEAVRDGARAAERSGACSTSGRGDESDQAISQRHLPWPWKSPRAPGAELSSTQEQPAPEPELWDRAAAFWEALMREMKVRQQAPPCP